MTLNNKTIRKQSINMKNILIIGATGQIGSELTMELRGRYGNDHVVAGYIIGSEPKGELKESGPSEIVDVTDGEMIAAAVKSITLIRSTTLPLFFQLSPSPSRSSHGKSALMASGMCWR